MTRSARIEAARQAHYQDPAPSRAKPDDGIDFARLKIEPRYLPALDGTQPYHRAPTCGRAAPISERRVAELVAEALEPPQGQDEDALSAALATPEGRKVLQDDPCEPGGDPFWTELFAGGAPKWDGAL